MRVERLNGPGGRWRVLVPETRRERMRGLRGHPPPGPREAMLFRRCRSVHTFGMARPISVAFLDADLRVVRVRRCRPRRVLFTNAGARHVLECDAGAAVNVGDRFRPRGRASR
jgi:uncharacterized membrane protein (UPF0127 family)